MEWKKGKERRDRCTEMLVTPFSLSPPHTPFFCFYNNALVFRLGTVIAATPPSDQRTRTRWRKILIRRKLVTFQAETSFEDPADDKGNPCILAPFRNR